MTRLAIALSALVALVPGAFAQPRGPQLPLAPGVMPASPFGPGMPFNPRPGTVQPSFVFPPLLPNVWDFGYGYGFVYPSYAPPYYYVVPQPPQVVEVPARPSEPRVVLAQEFPATLIVQFPVPAEVWLDGAKLGGDPADERVLTSPILKPGARHTFNVKARWTTGGKTYEATRTLALGPGDKSRLFILSGDEVK
ncbi:MAG: hypothetical protein FJ304_16450 [Planctomycetes bacterium]|nr:hypothetical protein [Planctomycetota bacterium]